MNIFSQKFYPPRNERKFRGSGLLVMALVGAAVVGITSLSLAKANSIAIHSMGANSLALQAQQYAASKAELLRSAKYSELTAQNKANIGNTGFQDEVVVGAETAYDASTMKKDVTIRVYRTGESVPRSSLVVTRYSKSMDASSVPSGSIIPWYGNLADIPDGFALCNGSNGTPDLRDRFIVGAGSSYALRATGGTDSVSLSKANLPSNAFTGSINFWLTTGSECNQDVYTFGNLTDYDTCWYTRTSGGGGYHYEYFKAASSLLSSLGWNNQAHENRPPFYALYYIMKL